MPHDTMEQAFVRCEETRTKHYRRDHAGRGIWTWCKGHKREELWTWEELGMTKEIAREYERSHRAMSISRGDTQFIGFAKLLCDELERSVALEATSNDWTEVDRKEVQQIIARCAGKLVWHALESCLISERAYSLVRHYYPLDIEASQVERHFDRDEMLQDVPDMTEWPERKEP